MFTIDFLNVNDAQLQLLCAEKLTAAIDPWEQKVWSFLSHWLDPQVTEITVYTSGSTGKPRPFVHSKQAMMASAQATCSFLDITPGQIALLALPADKIGGMMMLVRSWLCKLPLVCIPPSANPLNDIPADLQIQFAAFTPMQLMPVVNSYQLFRRLEAIKTIIVGGSEVPKGLTQWLKGLSNNIYLTFGMTETVSHIALKKLNGPGADAHFRLMPGVEITTDSRGCLQITAPGLGVKGLLTNDVVNVINKYEFEWLGRADNVINTGGVKVHPEMLEQAMKEDLLVPFFIAGIPDPVTGQKVVLVIERDTISDKELDAARVYLQQLVENTRPRQILLVPRFIRTENGKIKRAESLARVDTRFDL